MLPGSGEILGDLRYAARSLLRNPGFTFTVLITLTLAIGANAAIFTLANALLLASMPVPHPERLIEVSTIDKKGEKGNLSIPAFQSIQQRADVFSSVLAWNGGGMENLEMNGSSFAGSVDEIGGDYYVTLGIRPALGRFITREDIGLDHFTPSRVAVIGYRAWQERYGGDTGVLGKAILINGKPYTIIGVHPKSFPGLIREVTADATVPVTDYASSAEHLYDRKHDYYTVIGRLRDGISFQRARAQIEAVWPAIRKATAPDSAPEHASFLAFRIQVEPAGARHFLSAERVHAAAVHIVRNSRSAASACVRKPGERRTGKSREPGGRIERSCGSWSEPLASHQSFAS